MVYKSTPNVQSIASDASNLRSGNSSSYDATKFLAFYPQFANVVPLPVVNMFIEMALKTIQENRYRSAWEYATALFVAHHCIVWLRTNVATGNTDGDVVASAGGTVGVITSESVDGVSYNLDASQITSDLQGFGDYKSTSFGIQLATLSKQYGKGGMVVY